MDLNVSDNFNNRITADDDNNNSRDGIDSMSSSPINNLKSIPIMEDNSSEYSNSDNSISDDSIQDETNSVLSLHESYTKSVPGKDKDTDPYYDDKNSLIIAKEDINYSETSIKSISNEISTYPDNPDLNKSNSVLANSDDFADNGIVDDVVISEASRLKSELLNKSLPLLYDYDGNVDNLKLNSSTICTYNKFTWVMGDLKRFSEEGWYNDTHIDCLGEYYVKDIVTKERLNNITVETITSHFLVYYNNRGYNDSKSWLQKKNILTNNISVFWIHNASHWSVAMVINVECYLNTSDNMACIVISDSLRGYHDALKTYTLILNCLNEHMANLKGKNVPILTDINCPMVVAFVPQQDDGNQCGPYAIESVTTFLRNFKSSTKSDIKNKFRTIINPRSYCHQDILESRVSSKMLVLEWKSEYDNRIISTIQTIKDSYKSNVVLLLKDNFVYVISPSCEGIATTLFKVDVDIFDHQGPSYSLTKKLTDLLEVYVVQVLIIDVIFSVAAVFLSCCSEVYKPILLNNGVVLSYLPLDSLLTDYARYGFKCSEYIGEYLHIANEVIDLYCVKNLRMLINLVSTCEIHVAPTQCIIPSCTCTDIDQVFYKCFNHRPQEPLSVARGLRLTGIKDYALEVSTSNNFVKKQIGLVNIIVLHIFISDVIISKKIRFYHGSPAILSAQPLAYYHYYAFGALYSSATFCKAIYAG